NVMRHVHIEGHLTLEVERVLHKNRVDSSVSCFFREIDRALRRLNTRTRKQHHRGRYPLACGFDEFQLFGMFQIDGLAVGPENEIPFDPCLYVLVDVLLEKIVSDGPTLIEGRRHWRNDASEIKQRLIHPS